MFWLSVQHKNYSPNFRNDDDADQGPLSLRLNVIIMALILAYKIISAITSTKSKKIGQIAKRLTRRNVRPKPRATPPLRNAPNGPLLSVL